MELWNIVPNELKLMIFTALPVIGKGIISIPIGIYQFGFSIEKTTFWCSLGSCLKVGYYFLFIYGAEKWLIKKGFISAQRFEKWRKQTIIRHKTAYECVGIMSLAIVPNLGAGIFTGACLSYFFNVGFLRGVIVTVLGATLMTYTIAIGSMYSKHQVIISLDFLKSFFSG